MIPSRWSNSPNCLSSRCSIPLHCLCQNSTRSCNPRNRISIFFSCCCILLNCPWELSSLRCISRNCLRKFSSLWCVLLVGVADFSLFRFLDVTSVSKFFLRGSCTFSVGVQIMKQISPSHQKYKITM